MRCYIPACCSGDVERGSDLDSSLTNPYIINHTVQPYRTRGADDGTPWLYGSASLHDLPRHREIGPCLCDHARRP